MDSSARIKELDALYEPTGTWNDPRRNPHVWGQLVGSEFQKRFYYSARGLPLERRLLASASSARYYRRGNEERTLVHWGQRKLLLAEIEFLTLHGHLANTVVYAGAAPGTHLSMLALLFPNHQLHLYDPAPFNPHLVTVSEAPGSNVHLHQEMFTDEVAASWRTQGETPVLFVCDIRSANLDVQTHDEFEERVVIDMQAQKHWCELMKPAMASLKFRPPWDDKKLEYYAGDVYFQIWTGQKSTETRLFTDCSKLDLYDNAKYADQLFYFNTISRLALHAHSVKDVEGLDHCGDCAAELAVLRRYVEAFGLLGRRVASAEHAIGALCLLITKTLHGRTLADKVDHRAAREGIMRNQWVRDEKGVQKPAYQAELDAADNYLAGALPVDEHSPAALLAAELLASSASLRSLI